MPFPWEAVALMGSSLLEGLLGSERNTELRQLKKVLAERGIQLASSPGYSEAAKKSIFGTDFSKIRGQEAATGKTVTNTLARAGMAGTGTAVKATQENAWSNAGLVSQALRDLFIANEQKASSDVATASNILGMGAQASQILKKQSPPLTEALVNAMLMQQLNKTSTTGQPSGNMYESLANTATPQGSDYSWLAALA
jgi:hypothetical protein